MRLLFDQNLSPRLVGALSDLFPGSEHVGEKGLGAATDNAVWNYAKVNNLVIVTKDSDFNE
jgi:predicted nuclease of predicted toxin-antitoxin system